MFYVKMEQKVPHSLIGGWGVEFNAHAILQCHNSKRKQHKKRKRTMYLNCNGCGKLGKTLLNAVQERSKPLVCFRLILSVNIARFLRQTGSDRHCFFFVSVSLTLCVSYFLFCHNISLEFCLHLQHVITSLLNFVVTTNTQWKFLPDQTSRHW